MDPLRSRTLFKVRDASVLQQGGLNDIRRSVEAATGLGDMGPPPSPALVKPVATRAGVFTASTVSSPDMTAAQRIDRLIKASPVPKAVTNMLAKGPLATLQMPGSPARVRPQVGQATPPPVAVAPTVGPVLPVNGANDKADAPPQDDMTAASSTTPVKGTAATGSRKRSAVIANWHVELYGLDNDNRVIVLLRGVKVARNKTKKKKKKGDSAQWNSSRIMSRLGPRQLQSSSGRLYELEGDIQAPYLVYVHDTDESGQPTRTSKPDQQQQLLAREQLANGFPEDWETVLAIHSKALAEPSGGSATNFDPDPKPTVAVQDATEVVDSVDVDAFFNDSVQPAVVEKAATDVDMTPAKVDTDDSAMNPKANQDGSGPTKASPTKTAGPPHQDSGKEPEKEITISASSHQGPAFSNEESTEDKDKTGPSKEETTEDKDKTGPTKEESTGDKDKTGPSKEESTENEDKTGPTKKESTGDKDKTGPSKEESTGDKDKTGPSSTGDKDKTGPSKEESTGDKDKTGPSKRESTGDKPGRTKKKISATGPKRASPRISSRTRSGRRPSRSSTNGTDSAKAGSSSSKTPQGLGRRRKAPASAAAGPAVTRSKSTRTTKKPSTKPKAKVPAKKPAKSKRQAKGTRSPKKAKTNGRKRPRVASSLGEVAFDLGDVAVGRSSRGRVRMPPLKWWMNERVVDISSEQRVVAAPITSPLAQSKTRRTRSHKSFPMSSLAQVMAQSVSSRKRQRVQGRAKTAKRAKLVDRKKRSDSGDEDDDDESSKTEDEDDSKEEEEEEEEDHDNGDDETKGGSGGGKGKGSASGDTQSQGGAGAGSAPARKSSAKRRPARTAAAQRPKRQKKMATGSGGANSWRNVGSVGIRGPTVRKSQPRQRTRGVRGRSVRKSSAMASTRISALMLEPRRSLRRLHEVSSDSSSSSSSSDDSESDNDSEDDEESNDDDEEEQEEEETDDEDEEEDDKEAKARKKRKRKGTSQAKPNDSQAEEVAAAVSKTLAALAGSPRAARHTVNRTFSGDADEWSDKQEAALKLAFWNTNPSQQHFWRVVAQHVPGKTAAQCQTRHEQKYPTPTARKTKRVRPNDDSNNVAEDLAKSLPAKGKAPLKRKQVLRQMLDHADDAHARAGGDDVFAVPTSLPASASGAQQHDGDTTSSDYTELEHVKGKAKEAEEEEEEEDSDADLDEDPLLSQPERKTPAGPRRSKMVAMSTGKKQTPKSSTLRQVDRHQTEMYIHTMKAQVRGRSRYSGHGSSSNGRSAKPSKQTLAKSAKILKEIDDADMTAAQKQAAELDSDKEEEDFYFAEESSP